MEELVTRLSDFGISDEDIESIFFKMDADHDGGLARTAVFFAALRWLLFVLY